MDYVQKNTEVRKTRIGFSRDLFNLYIKMILSRLEVLSEFIIGEDDVNNIWYTDDTVAAEGTEWKLQENEEKLLEEIK